MLCFSLALFGPLLAASPAHAMTNPIPGLVGDSPAPATTADVTDDPAPVMATSPWRPTATNPHVVVFSSGVDVASLPKAFRTQVAHLTPSTEKDVFGYGTWTAASIFQVAPGARITSVNAYPSGRLSSGRLREYLAKVFTERATLALGPADAVLFAFPPEHYLDPTSGALHPANGKAYQNLFDTMSDRSFASADGENLGSLTWGTKRDDYQLEGVATTERAALQTYHAIVNDWRKIRASIGSLTGAGVPVVAPSGDSGSKLQSISGLSNLREVVTVGASIIADGEHVVAAATASGPSLEGAVKPDLLAPPATVAVVPDGSLLAKTLSTLAKSSDPVWDSSVEAGWDTASTVERGRLASSLGSATIVATGLAGLHAEGLTDVAAMRGTLLAAAEPIAGMPVWRQGAGALRTQPDRAYAESRPRVDGNADLGISPGTGLWSATLPVRNGSALRAATTLTDFAGFGRHGETVVRTVTDGAAPPVAGTPGTSDLTLAATSGVAPEGLYCGYTEVDLPGGVATVMLQEDVPTCLVQAMRFYVESRYIHNEPAEDVTFELLPALPPKVEKLADRPMSFLPMDPTHLPLYVEKVRPGGCQPLYPDGYPTGLDPDREDRFALETGGAVTGNETCAVFDAVPPGYYQTRLFANYSSPVASSAAGPVTDIGERVGYQKLPMWILPRALDGSRTIDGTGVDETVAAVDYHWDKGTNTWVVGDPKGTALRFAYGHLKRIVGTNVTSRVVDLLDHASIDAVDGFDALTLDEMTKISQLAALPVGDDLSAWRWSKSLTDPTGFDARFNPLYTPAGKLAIGVAKYPLKLATPNYLLHASVNFKYEITDSVVSVVLVAGDEVAVRTFEPKGDVLVESPNGVPSQTGPWGTVTGQVDVEFNIKPKGAPEATLYLVTLPTAYRASTGDYVYSAATASFGGMSVQYDTWTNATWPQVGFCASEPALEWPKRACEKSPTQQLHVFSVDSNYSAAQVVPGTCRSVESVNVCEDWTLQVHAPRSDARIHDVRYGSADPNDKLGRSSVEITEELTRYGVFRHRPDLAKPRFVTKQLLDAPGDPGTALFRTTNPFNGVTNNRFWDNVSLPLDFVTRYPGEVAFRIENDEVGHDAVAPLGSGAARVNRYVCYVSRSATVGGLVS